MLIQFLLSCKHYLLLLLRIRKVNVIYILFQTTENFEIKMSNCRKFRRDNISLFPYLPDSTDDDNHDDYHTLLENLSKKWLLTQFTHNVSAAAANSYWQLAVNQLPGLSVAKERCGVEKHVPGFVHIRRKLIKDGCPTIYMKFAYFNKLTNTTEIIHCTKAPARNFPKSKYTKLYEEAHIKVCLCITVPI